MNRRCHRHVLVLLTSMGLLTGPICAISPAIAAVEQNAATAEKTSTAQSIEQQRRDMQQEKQLLRMFADTLEQIRSSYVDANVSDRELIEAAIEGMVSRLDPYSNYIPPDQVEDFRRSVDLEFGGIGIEVARNGNQLQVISPLPGTPADRAGLQPGDVIIRIGEADAAELSMDQALAKLKGEMGTEVTITVLHRDEEEPFTVTLKREKIQIPSVLGFRRQADRNWDYFCDAEQQIAYVRLTAFGRGTARQLDEVLQELFTHPVQAVILDLRFNPGGLLTEAIQVSDMFLREGEIVRVDERNAPHRSWDAKVETARIPAGLPTAILVNRFSASASEVVAACLQDHHVAHIIGERTWGKGSVQSVIELKDGKSILKLTTASYLRPSGKNIHRLPGASEQDAWGVQPDEPGRLRLNLNETRQLVRHLRQQTYLPEPSEDDQTVASTDFTDRQLQKALELLRQDLETAAAPSP
jgi:carboxyl-terminal processing protease